jgi:hypothetical protein
MMGGAWFKRPPNEWPVLVERCFHALDHERIRFHDPTGRCGVASAGAAAMGVGVCILVAPEIVIGAMIITGAVIVAVAIKEELDAYRRAHPEGSREAARPRPGTEPASQEPVANRRPEPSGSPLGRDWRPPGSPESPEPGEPRPECIPRRVKPKGGDPLHNACANDVPLNAYRNANVLVNGKAFDALQPVTRTLWEVKTDNFDTYSVYLQRTVIGNQVSELRRERALAQACRFDFRIGVRSAAHKAALDLSAPDLKSIIVVMNWC